MLRVICITETPRERANSGEFEQIHHRDVNLQHLLQLSVNGNQREQIAADIEKIFIRADAVARQCPTPQRRYLLLDFGCFSRALIGLLWRYLRGLRDCVPGAQCEPIDLAVRR